MGEALLVAGFVGECMNMVKERGDLRRFNVTAAEDTAVVLGFLVCCSCILIPLLLLQIICPKKLLRTAMCDNTKKQVFLSLCSMTEIWQSLSLFPLSWLLIFR